MEDETKDVKSSMLHKLKSLPKASSNDCIFKVPECISNVWEACYKPLVISVGPIYYDYATLQSGQELKYRFLECFLEFSAQKNGNESDSLNEYIEFVKGWKDEAWSCYDEKLSHISTNDFVEMMVLDAAFIVYLIMSYSDEISVQKDPMSKKIALLGYLLQDLFLEDNQLPFIALSNLYYITFGAAFPDISFVYLSCNFIKLSLHIPGNEGVPTNIEASDIKHLVHLLRECCLPEKRRDKYPQFEEYHIPPSVKELKASGVKFKASGSKNLLDITFSAGVLEIPTLLFQRNTEAIIRGIIYFEECLYHKDSHFVDYACFLDALINTGEDVRILVKHGIIEHTLGSDEELANIINRITENVIITTENFYYSGIGENLKAHANQRWNNWKAILRRDYFSHPWSTISVGYLVILLALTVLQVYTGFK